MSSRVSRTFVPFVVAAVLAGTVVGAAVVQAQVTCYFTKCAVYPDGTRICERTPIECPTARL